LSLKTFQQLKRGLEPQVIQILAMIGLE